MSDSKPSNRNDSSCDLCSCDTLKRRIMGFNLCEDHFNQLLDEKPDDMYKWLKERSIDSG